MAFRFYFLPHPFDSPVRTDQERAANYTHVGAAHELFELPGAERFDGFVVGVTQERKIQFLFCLKICQRFHGIGADAEDGDPLRFEFWLVIAEFAGFGRAARCAGFRIKIDQDSLALEIGEGDFLALVGE